VIHVTVYNLSVALQTDEQKLVSLVDNFINKFYTLKGQSFNPNFPAPDKKFLSKLDKMNVYYLHVNQFRHLLHFLGEHNFSMKDAVRENKMDYAIANEAYTVREGWTLHDYQKPVVDFVTSEPKGSKMVSLQTGKGKAQTLDAKIKIPGGWCTMGDIQLGDTVTAKDGSPTQVTGVFPQGVTPVYEITFSDGRSTKVSCEHLWRVLSEVSQDVGTWSTLTTQALIECLSTPGCLHYINLCDSEQAADVRLPMNPFLFGRLVARGFEQEIATPYLHASHHQRTEVLKGLLDSKGTLQSTDRSVTYKASSLTILKQVQYLIRSIGGIARQEEDTLKLHINHAKLHDLFSLCHLEHKSNQRCKYLKVRDIVYIGEEPTQCISIDHPDKLYVTDDFIVTHNTFVALYALAQIKMRIAIVILPTYVEKWIIDITKTHEALISEVMVVQGSKALKALITMAQEGTLTSKYFIFSSRTMQEYISNYEADPEQSVAIYGIHPIELFPLLQVGSLLIDETHQHFHAIFKILLHANVKLQLGLSATLISDDSVVTNVHKVVYPPKTIYDAGGLDRYTDAYALAYYIPPDLIRKIRTSNFGSNSYSHTAFEQSVMKLPPMLKFYTSLIDNTMKDFYIEKYEDKDKCLIFVATVKMATLLTERYKALYPEKIVNRYCEDDPFEHILEGEIVVSTVISAGTAVDIPHLRVVIQTVSISSSVANIQTLGRLRKLKDGKDTRFCYLYAENVPKQKQYHFKRLDLFRDRVSSHRSFRARGTH
jgi:hypothetical protein